MQNESDALTIARWRWPPVDGNDWIERPYGARLAHGEYRTFEPLRSFDDIHDAERGLIECGLAEEYGRELIRVLFGEDEFGNPGLPLTPVSCATIATAPLDVRVRAMAAVIRARSDHGS